MMDERAAGQYWNENAEAWTALARAGHDIYRDYLNTPAFFEMLPDVKGLSGIDIGCGEGHNSNLLAQRGAFIHGIDISEKFIQQAIASRKHEIEYTVASATNLPFGNAHFDFASSFMCLMGVPDPGKALQEAYRVLKPGGFFQFSITHPCFATPHRRNLRDNDGKTYAIEVGGYFQNVNGKIDEWTFMEVPDDLKKRFPKFKTPIFNRTLTEWFNLITDAGFVIEKINEPRPGDEVVSMQPSLQDAQVVAYFLHVQCRKPVAG
jgi:SAM-dependent methyltransferase